MSRIIDFKEFLLDRGISIREYSDISLYYKILTSHSLKISLSLMLKFSSIILIHNTKKGKITIFFDATSQKYVAKIKNNNDETCIEGKLEYVISNIIKYLRDN